LEVLQLHSAVKSFGRKKIVREVSFQIEKGTIVGLFGRNGSGKSTLLKLLFGTLKADALEVSIDGQRVRPSQVIPKQLIGYAPQHGFLPKNRKVRDIIPLFHSSEEKQDAIFYDSHIATMTHKSVEQLSLGELKYFEVVLLSHLPHPFLMLDEPFSMLEPLHKERLKEFLVALKQLKGMLITDHYYQDVLEIADQNIVIKEGISYPITNTQDLQRFEYISKK